VLEANLLQRHVAAVYYTLAFKNRRVCAFSQLFQFHIGLDFSVPKLGHGCPATVPAYRLHRQDAQARIPGQCLVVCNLRHRLIRVHVTRVCGMVQLVYADAVINSVGLGIMATIFAAIE